MALAEAFAVPSRAPLATNQEVNSSRQTGRCQEKVNHDIVLGRSRLKPEVISLQIFLVPFNLTNTVHTAPSNNTVIWYSKQIDSPYMGQSATSLETTKRNHLSTGASP